MNSHPWLHENLTSAPEPGDTDWKLKRRNMFVRKATRYVHELKWHLIEIWSENRHSFIDQSTDQWQDCFIACLKTKSKHSEHLLWCVSLWYVTVMTFKAYTTAVINKLMYVSFHKVGWEQPSGDVDNFVAVLCKFTKVSVCQKLWIHYEVWQS